MAMALMKPHLLANIECTVTLSTSLAISREMHQMSWQAEICESVDDNALYFFTTLYNTLLYSLSSTSIC